MVLHECLTGSTPFQGDTPRGFLAQKLDTPKETPVPALPAPSKGHKPTSRRTLSAIVAAMIAPEPTDRPESAAGVSALLARVV
jgi:serine/threonine protein kinase